MQNQQWISTIHEIIVSFQGKHWAFWWNMWRISIVHLNLLALLPIFSLLRILLMQGNLWIVLIIVVNFLLGFMLACIRFFKMFISNSYPYLLDGCSPPIFHLSNQKHISTHKDSIIHNNFHFWLTNSSSSKSIFY